MLRRVLTAGDDDHLGLWPFTARVAIGALPCRAAIGVAAAAKCQFGPLPAMQLFVVLTDRRRDVVDVLLAVGMLGRVVPHIAAGLPEMVSGPR